MWEKRAERAELLILLSFATFCMRSSACDTLTRQCVRRVLCWPAFVLAPTLRSTGSAGSGSALQHNLPLRSPASSLLHPTWLNLGAMGIHGNGHMMMLEKNSDAIAGVMADWLDRMLPGGAP